MCYFKLKNVFLRKKFSYIKEQRNFALLKAKIIFSDILSHYKNEFLSVENLLIS